MIDLLMELSSFAAEGSSDSDSPWPLLVIGPAAGIGTYWALYRYYRNTDKSHQFERETLIEAQPVTGGEAKVGELKGTRSSRITGDNVSRFRDRVRRVS